MRTNFFGHYITPSVNLEQKLLSSERKYNNNNTSFLNPTNQLILQVAILSAKFMQVVRPCNG